MFCKKNVNFGWSWANQTCQIPMCPWADEIHMVAEAQVTEVRVTGMHIQYPLRVTEPDRRGDYSCNQHHKAANARANKCEFTVTIWI